MNYLIGNKNGIIGFVSIIDKNNLKQSVYCSFENNFFKRFPFDVDLIMQDPKYDTFNNVMDNNEIIERVLSKNISTFSSFKTSPDFYFFEDDWIERRKELEKSIREIIEKHYR